MFVYLIEAGEYYKIGISKNPDKRVRQIGANSPFDVKLLFKYQTQYAEYVERCSQLYFINKHVKREWFKLNKSDVYKFQKLVPQFNLEYLENNYLEIYQKLIKSPLFYHGLGMPSWKWIDPNRDKKIWNKF